VREVRGSGGTAGGYFVVNTTRQIGEPGYPVYVYGPDVSNHNQGCIAFSADSATLTVYGDIAGGNQNYCYGIYNASSGTVIVTGNVTGGSNNIILMASITPAQALSLLQEISRAVPIIILMASITPAQALSLLQEMSRAVLVIIVTASLTPAQALSQLQEISQAALLVMLTASITTQALSLLMAMFDPRQPIKLQPSSTIILPAISQSMATSMEVVVIRRYMQTLAIFASMVTSNGTRLIRTLQPLGQRSLDLSSLLARF
jgi:hypothetical protein